MRFAFPLPLVHQNNNYICRGLYNKQPHFKSSGVKRIIPGLSAFPGVEDVQELVPAGDAGHLLGLAGGDEVL